MSDIVWEEPPPSRYGAKRDGWNRIAAELRANPGRWARIRECETRGRASVWAQQVRQGQSSAWLPAGSFEAASRSVDGTYVVYARYVGGAAS